MFFAAHTSDPVGQLHLRASDYAWVTEQLGAVCPRIVSVLEGGYDVVSGSLAEATSAHVRGLTRVNRRAVRHIDRLASARRKLNEANSLRYCPLPPATAGGVIVEDFSETEDIQSAPVRAVAPSTRVPESNADRAPIPDVIQCQRRLCATATPSQARVIGNLVHSVCDGLVQTVLERMLGAALAPEGRGEGAADGAAVTVRASRSLMGVPGYPGSVTLPAYPLSAVREATMLTPREVNARDVQPALSRLVSPDVERRSIHPSPSPEQIHRMDAGHVVAAPHPCAVSIAMEPMAADVAVDSGPRLAACVDSQEVVIDVDIDTQMCAVEDHEDRKGEVLFDSRICPTGNVDGALLSRPTSVSIKPCVAIPMSIDAACTGPVHAAVACPESRLSHGMPAVASSMPVTSALEAPLHVASTSII